MSTIRALSSGVFFCIKWTWLLIFLIGPSAFGQTNSLGELVDQLAGQSESQVIAWRRDIHEHPELSNREYRTAELVAKHLRALDIEVTTGMK